MGSIYGKNKDYLSYSAIMLWLRSPEQYRSRYYELVPQEENVFLNFGKRIAKVLEGRDYALYPELSKVPYFPISEHKLYVDLKGVRVLGYLDLWRPQTFTFGEVKTGSVSHQNGPPWTKAKVMAHEQLPFYSLLIKETYGVVDPWTSLIWIETRFKSVTDKVGSRSMEGEGRELELTGKVEIFKRRIAEWERKRIRNLIKKCAKEISDDYESYLKADK